MTTVYFLKPKEATDFYNYFEMIEKPKHFKIIVLDNRGHHHNNRKGDIDN